MHYAAVPAGGRGRDVKTDRSGKAGGGFPPAFALGCLRRHTFCQQRQKVCKKRRQSQGFGNRRSDAAAAALKCRGTSIERRDDAYIVPNERTLRPFISRRQRQRRRREDDTKLRMRPTETLRADRKGSPETYGFWRAFGYFSHAGKVTKSAPRPRWSACGIFGRTMPKFRIVSTCCTVSGSGAEGQTILQHWPLAKSSKRVGRTKTIAQCARRA